MHKRKPSLQQNATQHEKHCTNLTTHTRNSFEATWTEQIWRNHD